MKICSNKIQMYVFCNNHCNIIHFLYLWFAKTDHNYLFSITIRVEINESCDTASNLCFQVNLVKLCSNIFVSTVPRNYPKRWHCTDLFWLDYVNVQCSNENNHFVFTRFRLPIFDPPKNRIGWHLGQRSFVWSSQSIANQLIMLIDSYY